MFKLDIYPEKITNFDDVHKWMLNTDDTKSFRSFLHRNVKSSSARYNVYLKIWKQKSIFKCENCSIKGDHYKLIRHNKTYNFSFQLYNSKNQMMNAIRNPLIKQTMGLFTHKKFNSNSCLLCDSCIKKYNAVLTKYANERTNLC